MKKVILIPLISFLVVLVALFLVFSHSLFKKETNTRPIENPVRNTGEVVSTEKEPHSEKPIILSRYELKVPFMSQAPFANWDELHDEACEEASLLLVDYYKKNKTPNTETFDGEIKALVNYQIKKYGSHKNLTIEEVRDIARDYFGYKNSEIIYNFTWQQAKEQIVANNPIIVPAAGRELGNKYFRNPGPVYHMFVIRGYNESDLITSEVGTKRGDGLIYSYKTLDRAIHNWTGNETTITSGERAMLILK